MDFLKGLLVVTWIYTAFFAFYQWSYAQGEESVVCPRPGYNFDRTLRFK